MKRFDLLIKIAGISAICAWALSACMSQSPTVSSTQQHALFDHSVRVNGCLNCHDQDRPGPKHGFAHGDNRDCVSCHNPKGWKNNVHFDHPAVSRTCDNCHEGKRPGRDPKSGAPHGNNVDCVACHITRNWKTILKFAHDPNLRECSSCHEKSRPDPKFGYPHGENRDCILCHTPNPDWKTILEFEHPSDLRKCETCHEDKRPSPQLGVAHGEGRDCIECHLSQNWKTIRNYMHHPEDQRACNDCHLSVRPVPAQGKIHGGNLDCTQCHLFDSWKTLKEFDHTNSKNSCAVCHKSGRPKDHRNGGLWDRLSGHYNDTDCNQCHGVPAANQKSWSYQHVDSLGNDPQACVFCHEADGRAYHWPSPNFFQRTVPDRCVECHRYKQGWDDVHGSD